MSHATVRPPAVAGMFYPALPDELERSVRGFLEAAETQGAPPKAMILPHAGYIYSGPIAASGYHLIEPVRDRIERVVLIGPAHRHYFVGVAAPRVEWFDTPLGSVPIDTDAVRSLAKLPQVKLLDAAHEGEHSLEVHLPFLQTLLDDFKLVPLVVGEASPDDVAVVLDGLWGGPETLVVVSSDLSHFESYDHAKAHDQGTAKAIESLHAGRIGPRDACGCIPIGGLLEVARKRGLEPRTIDLRSSGDTAGSYDEVVGYGAFVI